MANERAWDTRGAAAALHEVTEHYGYRALSDPRVLENLLSDLLPEAPTEARLLVLAAQHGLPSSLAQLCQHVEPDEAVRLAAGRFVESYPIEESAGLWAAAVLAEAMGHRLHMPGLAHPVDERPAPRRLDDQETVNRKTLSAAPDPRSAAPVLPEPARPAGPPTHHGRRPLVIAAVAVVAASAAAAGTVALIGSRRPVVIRPIATTSTIALPSSSTTTTATTTAPAPSTSAPVTVPSTTTSPPAIAQTAELQSGWANDPSKCGPEPTDQSQPYSATHTYQVTATIHLWPGPSTAGTPLAEIEVTSNGPGGIGCASGTDPTVTVTCTTKGQPITGPFGTDPLWDKTTYGGQDGFVPDEWIDTKWDAASLPTC